MDFAKILGISSSKNNKEVFAIQSPNRQEISKKIDFKHPNLEICEICFDNVKSKPFLSFLKCKDIYCLDCLKKYFAFKLNAGDILQIKCPGSCGAIFSEFQLLNQIIPMVLDAAEHKKYKQKMIEALTNKWDQIWCVKLNCGRIIKNKKENKGICECGFEICFECREQWHPNQKCADVMKKNLQIETFIVRPCPICKVRIEKSDGCNNMICNICNSAWCWHCGEVGNGHTH